MMNNAASIAKSYLLDDANPSKLMVEIDGRKRTLFVNRNDDNTKSQTIGILYIGKRTKGYVFTDWDSIDKVFIPKERSDVEENIKLVNKYMKLAEKAEHTNPWIRKIKKADIHKNLFENGITTGTRIDGKCIRLSTIEKYCGEFLMEEFKNAVKNKLNFNSYRFDFCGYDGRLWCEVDENGDVKAGFSKEYRNFCNGYYYLLINNDCVIGYDID